MENTVNFLTVGLAVLSVASGMLGLGVAFAAVPFLGFFLHDLTSPRPRSISRWRRS